jgi:tripartite-type tricarboxylate transporter receptor subunit TctC
MVEYGYPGFVITFWTGVVAPAGTPAELILRLNRVINDGLRSDTMKASLAKFHVEPRPATSADFAGFIASETKRWAGVIASAGIKAD